MDNRALDDRALLDALIQRAVRARNAGTPFDVELALGLERVAAILTDKIGMAPADGGTPARPPERTPDWMPKPYDPTAEAEDA